MAVMLFAALMLTVPAEDAPATETKDRVNAVASPEDFVAPQLLEGGNVPIPSDAPPLRAPVTVVVRLRVDPTGKVTEAELLTSAGPPFDAAVLEAVKAFVFSPGRFRGEPVDVDITFSQEFAATATDTNVKEEPRSAVLHGTVLEKGTRRKVELATVVAIRAGEELRATSDEHGVFSLALAPGEYSIAIVAPGYKRFLLKESLAENERVEVRYILQRLSYDPFETIVRTRKERNEVSRTTLRDRELRQVPGTFGDPFRVVSTMPGVGQVFSLLNYPIVRGTAPGNTGFLLDGVPVPQLFHLFAGPSVIHPEFIDRVDFFPGVFASRYGGYTGGIVDGVTRRARPDEQAIEASVDMLSTGLFVREPLETLGATATFAGRYGYPGMLLSALNTGLNLSYWDYQARLDAGQTNRFTAFVFGSFDELETEQAGQDPVTVARTQFHRLDLRYVLDHGENKQERFNLVLGVDEVLSGDSDASADTAETTISAYSVSPRFEITRPLMSTLALEAGVEGRFLASRGGGSITDQTGEAEFEIDRDVDLYSGGAYLELPWQLTRRLLVTPGVRADVFKNQYTTKASVDPRVRARFELLQVSQGPVFLKGGFGSFHGPPRLPVQVPAFEALALQRGLVQSWQGTFGLELPLHRSLALDAQSYFSYMSPIINDLAINSPELGAFDDDSSFDPEPTGEAPPFVEDDPSRSPALGGDTSESLLTARRTGRSFGLEVMLRKRDEGPVFGWLSYTLSKSDRRYQDQWVPYDFDRRHMMHLVLGYRLPRNWSIGGRIQMQSGRPVTTNEGYNAGRATGFFRADLRIDKTAVYQDWLLDFYVDVINVTLAEERLDQTQGFPYVLPSVGFKARL